jgi:hypothetical protein
MLAMPTRWRLVLQCQPTRQSVRSPGVVHLKLHGNGIGLELFMCSKQSV